MQSNFYVALSGQLALQRRLDSIAHNVANASTPGFRAEHVKFAATLSQVAADPVAFATSGRTYLSRTAGEYAKTDNPLDVAVEGDAWLGMLTPSGTVYTRDGRFKMSEGGQLQTVDGYAVLDAGGTPIQLDPNAGPPAIARDGTITQNRLQVGAIGLFHISERANLTRFENSGVIADQPATPTIDFVHNGMRQGFIEGANVNAVMEMTNLIMVSRAFDAIATAITDSEANLQDAIKVLSPAG
jgi:flagellar basal-body rod protein FlgF